MIGSLLYASITTRIDIAFPVALASRYLSAPTNKTLFLVNRIMRYLRGEHDRGISYEASKNKGLIAYCDSDFANDEEGRSTSGMVFLFAGAPIHWRSLRQTSVSLSPTEAEVMSLCTTVKELVWLRNLMLELKLVRDDPTPVYCDNTSAIRLGRDEKAIHRTKHLRAQFYFCHEQVQNKVLDIKYINTNDQLADYLTKPLQVNKFIDARDKMITKIVYRTLFAAFLAMSTVSLWAHKFEEVGPILYQQTDKFVDIGVAEYTIDFSFFNPCAILNKYLPPPIIHPDKSVSNVVDDTSSQSVSQDEIYVRSFIDECQHLYHDTFMMKIGELLSRQPPPKPLIDPHMNEMLRVKRSLASEIVFGICATDLICTLFEPVLPWSSYHKLQELQELMRLEHERFQKLQHSFNTSLVIQKGILEMVANNTRSIREQKRQFGHFVQLSSRITWLSGYIQTRIMMVSTDLRNVIDHMIRGNVATLELSEIFNITALRQIDPRDTEFVSVSALTPSTLRFKFNVRLRAADTFIYQVHAFR